MKYYLNCKKISTATERAKKMLIARANKKGLYENFGQDEVMEIEFKFINTSDYSDEMNRNRDMLQSFNEWCMTYTG